MFLRLWTSWFILTLSFISGQFVLRIAFNLVVILEMLPNRRGISLLVFSLELYKM